MKSKKKNEFFFLENHQSKNPRKKIKKRNRKRNRKRKKIQKNQNGKIQKKKQKKEKIKKIEKENPKKSKKRKEESLFSVALDKMCVFCLYPITDSLQCVKRDNCRSPILSGLLFRLIFIEPCLFILFIYFIETFCIS